MLTFPDIPNIETLLTVLTFLYTDTFVATEVDLVIAVLLVAHEYQIERLLKVTVRGEERREKRVEMIERRGERRKKREEKKEGRRRDDRGGEIGNIAEKNTLFPSS